jgi:hypothetical protein
MNSPIDSFDDPIACSGCGAMAGCCGDFPNCVGNPNWQPDETHDNCSRCHGARGGVRGNENWVNGVLLCDYCHAELHL